MAFAPRYQGDTGMLCIRLGIMVCFTLCVAGANSQTTDTTSAPSDSEIRQILANRIDVEKQSVGIVIGVIEPREVRHGLMQP